MTSKIWVELLPWFAVLVLSLGYWSQVWKIHVHKEVRDLSILSYGLLALGFCIMSWKAYQEGTVIFLVKQVMTLIPVSIVIAQIWLHRGDAWHDENAPLCAGCDKELEELWQYCPACGESRPQQQHDEPAFSSASEALQGRGLGQEQAVTLLHPARGQHAIAPSVKVEQQTGLVGEPVLSVQISISEHKLR